MTPAAVISGVGEVAPVRRSGLSAMTLVAGAIRDALADAGIGPADIEGLVVEGSVTPRLAPPADVAAALDLSSLRVSAMASPVGAGILQSVGVANELVVSGVAKHVLVYFGLDWGTRPMGPASYHEAMEPKRVVETPAGFAGPPVYFAVAAKRYGYTHGKPDDELELALADVVMANRHNATAHPEAQVREPMALSDYRSSPLIAEPLRKADCALLSDGAMAIVLSRGTAVTSERATVSVAGWSWAQDTVDDASFYSQSSFPELPATRAASMRALRAAAVSVSDVDLVEIYDCFSIATILQLEALGFCKPGGGPEYVAEGRLRFDGDHPTNTHGGLLSHGYVMGGNHLVEAVKQLRGDAGARQVVDAATGLVGAGPGRQYTALVLRRADA
jgi:acetyl-CoA acetyltransferase